MATLREYSIGWKKEGIIYSIVNVINSKVYIGSTNLFYKRKSSHIRQLEQNKHHSIHLQRAYNKYGENAFEWDILQKVENLEDLFFYEQKWIDLTQSTFGKYGYNINPVASAADIPRCTKEQIERRNESIRKTKGTSEFRKKISDYNKSIGKKIPSFYENRKDVFTFPNQRLNVDQIREIILMANQKIPRKIIMEKFNISRGYIYRLINGLAWKCLNKK